MSSIGSQDEDDRPLPAQQQQGLQQDQALDPESSRPRRRRRNVLLELSEWQNGQAFLSMEGDVAKVPKVSACAA